MIRPFTCLTVLLAAGSGMYLYTEKHRTTLLDDRIRAVVAETHRTEDRTSMLRAEWALLNQPDRLQALAAKFLPALQPMAPTQFVAALDLDRRLPPEGPPREMYGPPAPPALMPTAPEASVVLASAVVRSLPVARPATFKAAAAMRRPVARRTLVASAWRADLPQPLVRPAMSYGTPAPILAGAWHAAPASPAFTGPAFTGPAFTGSALGMAHAALAPPMAAR